MSGGVQEEQGYRFLSPGNIDAFKFLKVLQQRGCAWVPSPDLPVYDRFAGRQALFATASLEELSDQSRSFLASGSRDEWTVLPFPGAEQDAFVLYGDSFVMLESDDVTQLPAWLFMRWMLSSENQVRWVQSTGLFPLRTSTVGLLGDYAADHQQWAAAVEMLTDGHLSPRLASWRVEETAAAVTSVAAEMLGLQPLRRRETRRDNNRNDRCGGRYLRMGLLL